MDNLFHSCPQMDFAALEEKILTGALSADNYLFYRTFAPFSGWPDIDERQGTAWELHCTACHRRAVMAKRRGFKPSALTCCPECGAEVQAKKWLPVRKSLQTRILFYEFQRGEGRRVWLHAYAVTHDFCPEPGYERLDFKELARYLFDDGKAYKWTFTYRYFGETVEGGWTRRKRVTKTVWHRNTMSETAPYPAFVGSIDQETISGSCLEYSQLDRAIEAGFDIPEYLDYYLRNPMIEYLWKFGLERLLWESLMNGRRQELRLTVNLKAKRPKDLLPGLTVSEVRRIAENTNTCNLRFVRTYRRLKESGEVEDSVEGFAWAAAVNSHGTATDRAKEHGISGKQLRSYIERQAARAGTNVGLVLHDYGDYLHQLDELGGGELMPRDLFAVHERLSARLRKFSDYALNCQFRARRRLHRWLCWRHGGMLIRPVDSVQEITREGELQCNCVAGYARQHADGSTVICVLRRADAPCASWHTVELNPQTLEVRQCRGFRNAPAEPEAQAFVAAWTERLKNIRFGRKTA